MASHARIQASRKKWKKKSKKYLKNGHVKQKSHKSHNKKGEIKKKQNEFKDELNKAKWFCFL
jgi:hypothetical protein